MDGVIFDPTKENKEDSNGASVAGSTPDGQTPQDTGTIPPGPEDVPAQAEIVSGEVPVDVTPNPIQVEEGVEQPMPYGTPPRIGGLWKKIIIGILIVSVLVFLTFLFLPRGASSKEAKLVWWGLWEDERVVKSLIDDFQKQNPKVTVEYVKQDPKQYREKLQTRIKNGSGPDVFRFHNTWVPMLSQELLPLSTDVMSPTEFKKTYYPVMQKDLTQSGAIYGIPLGVDALALFVNTKLLDSGGVAPPQTWEEFVTGARKLTVKDDGKIVTAGAALGTYGNVTHAPDILSLLFIQQGIDMEKFPGESQEDKVAALNFYTSFTRGEQSVWDATLDESLLSFARGNLAMYIGFSWDIFRIKTLNKDLDFKTYPVPQLVGGNSGLASYWAEGVSAKSQNKEAALLFMQYLAKKETNQKFYTEASKTREFGEAYPRLDLASALKDNAMLAPFVAGLDGASSSFFASDTSDGEGGINSVSNTYLGNAINAMVNDNSSAETVVETLNQGVSQVFNKYGIK
jgi:multiple sugar transport system substrate-binding protein